MVETLPPEAARIHVDRTQTDTNRDFTIEGDHIGKVSTRLRAGRPTDEGEIVLHNDGWRYSDINGETPITIGDVLTLVGKPPQDPTTPTGFGEGPFGYGPFGDYVRLATYQVQDWDIVEYSGAGSDMMLTVADFVYSTLSDRTVFYRETGVPISGADDAVLNTVLRENCPEIDRSALPDIPDTVDYFTSGKTARTVVNELAAIASDRDGPVSQTSYGRHLVFEPLSNMNPKFDEPLTGDHFEPWNVSSDSSVLANEVRISGGIDDEKNVDDQQTTVDHYYRVTNSDRLTYRVDTRKSELTSLEVWTAGDDPNSDDGIRARLQVDTGDGSGPIAPGDTDSDIISSGSLKVALSDNGWRTVRLGEHTIPERQPWLIIDSEGSDGHEVGVDANNNPAFRAYYPKPVAAVIEDPDSIDAYGRVETHIENRGLTTGEAVRNQANAALEQRAYPGREVGPIETMTPRASRLRTGEIVELNRPEMRAEGEFIVTERQLDYQGSSLTTQLAFEGVPDYA